MSKEGIPFDREKLKSLKKLWIAYGEKKDLFEIWGGPKPIGTADSYSDVASRKSQIAKEIAESESTLSDDEKSEIDREVAEELNK